MTSYLMSFFTFGWERLTSLKPCCLRGLLWALMVFLGLTACSQQPALEFVDKSISRAEAERLLSSLERDTNSLERDTNSLEPIPLKDHPLSPDDGMRTFVSTFVNPDSSSDSRLQQLMEAIFHGGLLGLRYEPLKTYSAVDTFYRQEGNCLSFTFMFVALAREADLKVWFNEVKVPPVWDMQGSGSEEQMTHVYYRHMNAVVQTRGKRQVVDLNMENYDVDYPQQRVSQDYAMAQYYNNRAMESLFEQRLDLAYAYLREGIGLQPQLSFLWGNLGTLLRRSQRFEEAEVAYLYGLQLDPRDLMIVSNLGRLYGQLGDQQQAVRFNRLADSYRQRNPYYQFYLAQQALDQRELSQALAHIDVALKEQAQDHRFYFLAARIHSALGHAKQARDYLRQAASMTRDTDQRNRYHAKLERLARLP